MKKIKNKKVIPLTLCIALAVLIIAGAIYLLSKGNDSMTLVAPTATVTPNPAASDKTDMETEVEPEKEALLSKNAYPKINTLMESYFAATLSGDKTAFNNVISNPDSIDFDQLSRKFEYILDYEDINCYTAKGINGIDLIVYVTYGLKLPSIDTAAPSIDEYYIYYDSNNEPKIYLGPLKEDTAAYINEVRSSEEVTALITSVSDRLSQAIESDSGLKDFYSSFQLTDDTSDSENTNVSSDSSTTE